VRLVDERPEIVKTVRLRCNFLECVPLLASLFEEVSKFLRANPANLHFLAEAPAIESRGADVVVPHHVQIIDRFDGD
jgi:hypothetical protein